jgi:hypothetical protein
MIVTSLPSELRRRFPIALEIEPAYHLRMQAAFQAHVDAAVSKKTVNLPPTAPVNVVRDVYQLARQLGLKGVTVRSCWHTTSPAPTRWTSIPTTSSGARPTQAVMEHAAVAEAGVIGKPDPLIGEVVKAFVSLKAGHMPSEALRKELLGFARTRLGPAVAPREIDFRDSVPKTRSGKIMRRLLKARELGLPEGDLSTLEDDV